MSALIARLTADVKRIVGAAKISSVVIIQVQIAEMHPSEALVATPPQLAQSPPCPATLQECCFAAPLLAYVRRP